MMLARSCLLRQLMVARRRRRVMMRFDYNNFYIQTTPPTSFSSRHLRFSSYSHPFNSIGGLPYDEWRAKHSEESKIGGECDSEKEKVIEQGDLVDISELLFTKQRDYLIRYNDPKPVTADQLEGKFIVLYFLPFHYHVDAGPRSRMFKESLIDTINDLKFKNCFEVVMVVDEVTSFDGECGQDLLTLQGKFEDIVSKFPSGAAIPFSDIKSRKRLKSRFGHFGILHSPRMVLIHSKAGKGLVVDTFSEKLFLTYGSEAYPFSEDRIAFLKAKDKMAFSQHSLKELLGSSERDFVISNKGEEVQFSQLAGKRVIFLFEGDYPEYDGEFFRCMLKSAYRHAKGTANEFEVIYFPNNKDINGKRVADMPWLMSCPVELLPGGSAYLSFYGNSYNRYHSSLLLAFGRDGSLVRRAICPWLGDHHFPFYSASEAFDIENSDFCWGYWDTLYQGVLGCTSGFNFLGANHLFSVYYYNYTDDDT